MADKLFHRPDYVLSLEEAEKRILESEGTCYFDGYVKEGCLSVIDFVANFFSLAQKHNTLHESGKYETGVFRNRSIVDVFRACKYYYPECTLADAIRGLKKLAENKDLAGFYCCDIHRFIMQRKSIMFGWRGDPLADDKTEFGCSIFHLFKQV
jgi:hypothetical protein